MNRAGAGTKEALVLVTGHESRDVPDFAAATEDLPVEVVVCTRRVVHHQVGELLGRTDLVAVLPMTWGRDPVLVADTAKALQWFASTERTAPRIMLCAGLGTPDHVVAHLRRAVRETATSRPGAGVVITAPSENPFDDAELHRLAHLVRAHGAGVEVEVACLRPGREQEDLDHAVARFRRLGTDEVVVVPAGFARSCAASASSEGVHFHGPLLNDASLGRTIAARLGEARLRLGSGDDGITEGLLADHGHGYAHSHAVTGEVPGPDHDHDHDHGHGHGHGPVHIHPQGRRSSPRRDTRTTPEVREPSEVER